MGYIREKKIVENRIEVLPCVKCGSEDIEINDAGYSSFNVAWGKCKNCNNELKLSPCSWSITKAEIAKYWNNANNPKILKADLEAQIRELEKKIAELPK